MKKKLNDVKHGKRNFGIFLVFLQLLALLGTINSGEKLSNSFFELLGFFLPGIIGIILIAKDNSNDGE